VFQKEAQGILDNLKDNKKVRTHYNNVLKILNRIGNIMEEVKFGPIGAYTHLGLVQKKHVVV